MHNIDIIEAGFCRHPEFMVMKGGRWQAVEFPAMVALIHHPQGNILLDTGYAAHFFEATEHFPEKLYALTTPVNCQQSARQLISETIDTVVISHFHADHIAGLKDFPYARFLCSEAAYHDIQNTQVSRFNKTRKGLLPSLLPENFAERVSFFEQLPLVALPEAMHPFEQGYLLYPDIYAIALPGHARGHFGLLYKNCFFIADAVWTIKTLSENRRPNKITHWLADDVEQYHQTIDKLQQLYQRRSGIHIIPSHCAETIAKIKHLCSPLSL